MASNERHERPVEQPAARTTIVGGRPPGPGKGVGTIPRGIEVLVKKASVDADFRRLLLAKRAEAAKEIELSLEPAEAMMLDAVPAAQLEAIIASTTVTPVSRAAFLGRAAAVMLAALSGSGCEKEAPPPREVEPITVVLGERADRPPDKVKEMVEPAPTPPMPPKPKTETPTATPPPSPEQPIMPVAGAIPQPIPRMKPKSSLPPTNGIRPDRP